MALFTVLKASRETPESASTEFVLKRDAWDDYGFKTQYQLYVAVDGEMRFIGTVKILQHGQRETSAPIIEQDFNELGKGWMSVGDSLDYYQRINELPKEQQVRVLNALMDVIIEPTRRAGFADEPGWSTSVFRDRKQPAWEKFLVDAAAIYSQDYSQLPSLDMEFEFTPGGWETALEVNYDSPNIKRTIFPMPGVPYKQIKMPRRCAVIIGKNGSGKSTLLSRLARVAFASPSERAKKDIQSIGVLKPEGIGFFRIITISYSAFDSFSLPGVMIEDVEQIAKDVERGEGRYIFCGLRDVAAEAKAQLERFKESGEEASRLPIDDRLTTTKLKPIEALADEFEAFYARIIQRNRLVIFKAALNPVLADSSFSDLESPTVDSLFADGPRNAFMKWSTGHKICLHVIASLVAHAVPQSLVLFDEPEAHLHPPLTAALMHGVRIALERTEAFAVIATHSPVVLQETLARHVRVIERRGDLTTLRTPNGETFGENIGTIVYDTFGLTSSGTDYHEVLEALASVEKSVVSIDEYFSPSLSAQARSYILALLGSETDETSSLE